MSFFSSSKTVLILKDEGLQIFYASKFAAKYIDLIPWETEGFVTSVSDIIINQCRRSPVVILNDMVEQHYRKERIPKVNIMDRKNVLKRRLSVSFPNYKIRAALKLQEGRKKDGNSGSYLFAAIGMSEQISQTLAAVTKSMTGIKGVYLLPVEAADMVKALSSKLREKGNAIPQWSAFVGQHENGGLRQVVTRNGNLALTRMTPIIDTDVEPDIWAKEVAAELLATMSYLTRLGYKDGDGLDIVIAANDSTKEILSNMINIDCELEVLNTKELASLLGINLTQQQDGRYADHLYAAYLAKKVTLRLPLHIRNLNGFILPRRIASFGMIVLLGACIYFGFNAFQKWQKTYLIDEKNTISNQELNANRASYKQLLISEKRLGYDLLFVNNSAEVYRAIEGGKGMPAKLIDSIAKAMGADLRLDEVKIERIETEKEGEQARRNPFDMEETIAGAVSERYAGDLDNTEASLSVALFLSFPNTVNLEKGVARINKFKENLQTALPDYQVNITRQIADLSYTGNFVGDAGGDAQKPEEYAAEISISRKLK